MLKLSYWDFKDIAALAESISLYLNHIIKLLMMLLMSCRGIGVQIKSTALIGVATQNVGYAKSLSKGD